MDIPETGGDDGGGERPGQLAQEVSEGAQPPVEGAQQTSLDHQLVDGVGHLEQVVEVFGSPVVGRVGVFQFVSVVLLGVEAFVLNFPSQSSSLIG